MCKSKGFLKTVRAVEPYKLWDNLGRSFCLCHLTLPLLRPFQTPEHWAHHWFLSFLSSDPVSPPTQWEMLLLFSFPRLFKGSTVGCVFASGKATPALISLHLSTAFQEGTAHPNHLITSSGINHSRSTDVKKTMLICISTWPGPISL